MMFVFILFSFFLCVCNLKDLWPAERLLSLLEVTRDYNPKYFTVSDWLKPPG